MTLAIVGIERNVGRPRKFDEDLEKREIMFPLSLSRRLDTFARQNGQSMADVVRVAVEREVSGEGKGTGASEVPPKNIDLPIIGASICGPLEDAITDTHDILWLNEHIRKLLHVDEEDIVIRSYGNSMDRAGIVDGDLVIMTPLAEHARPKNGEIALVQVTTPDGGCTSTLKFWFWRNGGPVLEDAEGNEVELPEDAEQVEPIAVARARLGRI